jgi:CheY-like chemotaxis protein
MLGIEVIDTGIGVHIAEHEKIFDAFEQISKKHKGAQGTGLGLAISRQYARIMGGDLTIIAPKGQGATFRVDIPFELGDAGELAAAATRNRHVTSLKPRFAGTRVLIADDEANNRVLLTEMLSAMGFDIREACNGEEAVELTRAWHPRIVLMDTRMPILSGTEATIQIKADPALKNIPVVAVTASVFSEMRESIETSGTDDFVSKPFREKEIYDVIAKHTGVEYIYAEDQVAATDLAAHRTLTPELLKDIPDETRNQMRAAIQVADIEQLRQLIEQIGSTDTELATRLQKLADAYAYDALADLFGEAVG